MRYLVFLLATLFSSQLQAQETVENNISAVVDCNNITSFTFSDTDPHDEWKIVEWNFGDGIVVNEMPVAASLAHTYGSMNSAVYTVALKKRNVITDEISTTTRTIFVVNEQPSFTPDVLETCLQNKVTFTPSGIKSQYIKTYQWVFGNGDTTVKINSKLSSKFDASIAYAFGDPGRYNIELTIADVNGCTRAFTYPHTVHIKGPVAKFKATTTTSCKEESFSRTIKDASVPDNNVAIVKWDWYVWETGTTVPAVPSASFDNAHPMNAAGVSFPFSNTGHMYKGFSVKLIVTDNDGCISAAKTSSSYIKSYWPKAAFECNKTLLCNEYDALLTDASIGNKLDYTWDYGDGVIGTDIGSHLHTYKSDGLYSLKLTVAEKGMSACQDALTKDNYIKVVSVKSAFEISNDKRCAPLTVNFIDHSTNAGSYNWEFGDAISSVEKEPVHMFPAGDYTIILTVKSAGGECSSSTTTSLHVFEKPQIY
jgi:PKD repeat protein